MKVLVDTNIFIDILQKREPFWEASSMVYKLCENSIIEGYIAPITINNIHYVCRKTSHIKLIKSFLFDMSVYFDIAYMNEETIKKANYFKISDYEDSLQYAMAIQNGCEYFVTRNVKDFKNVGHIQVLEPIEFLKIFS
jgi:predicted nucleic acid-binding protein